MTSPCLSRDPKSLREYRDELRARLASAEKAYNAMVFQYAREWAKPTVDELRTRLAAVEAELAERGQG